MSRSGAKQCRWCGRFEEGNAGDYYHEKECHRRDVVRRMDSTDPDDLEAMAKLEQELFEASYTGD